MSCYRRGSLIIVKSMGHKSVNSASTTCTAKRLKGMRVKDGACANFGRSFTAMGPCLKASNVGPFISMYGRRGGKVFVLMGASGPSDKRFRSHLVSNHPLCRLINRGMTR